ncbi:MAG: hypothetical protein Q9182_002813 [Xanthomendoza sp. 2 TL-2023]
MARPETTAASMDPLSAIASVIAISGAVSATLDKVCQFYAAEAEVILLVNEVNDLRLVLTLFQRAIREYGQSSRIQKDHAVAIAKVSQSAQAGLEDLQGAIQNGLFRSDISQIQLQLTSFTTVHEDLKTLVDEQNQYLKLLLQKDLKDDFRDLQLDSSAQKVSPPIEASYPSPDTSLGSKSSHFSDAKVTQELEQIRQQGSNPNYGAIRIRAFDYRKNGCVDYCSCRCHQVHALQSPGVLKRFLGSLFVGYNGIPSLTPQCTEKNCRRRLTPTIRVSYYFPDWMMKRMLRFALSVDTADGIKVSLRAPQVVPDNSAVFECAVKGDLAGMSLLFDQGFASPFDVGIGTGRTALHYAVNYDHPKLARFLLDKGSSPHAEDQEQATTIAIAWRRIFGGLGAASHTDTFQRMFDDDEFLDTRNFQPLHKIILGISTVSLEQHLQLSTSNIDAVDADGRTALSWAATRGDFEAVRTLLSYYADPNVPSYYGQTTLHWAAQNKRQSPYQILKELIAHGAEVNAIDYWNRTALTYASGNTDLATVKLLVERKTPLNVRDRRLRTALGYAARMGNFEHAQYLLSSGADPNIPDEFNVLPLLEAVKNNFHGIVALLAPVSNPLQVQPYGSSLLHWIATYGDIETLEIIQKTSFENLFEPSDIDLTNAEDLTPQNIADERAHGGGLEKQQFRTLSQAISDMDNDLSPYHTPPESLPESDQL